MRSPERDPSHISRKFDPTSPSEARIYDYLLGGKDNFKVDRDRAEEVMLAFPRTRDLVWENRKFMERAVRNLALQGIRQFIDIGSGLPGPGNVHDIATQESAECHVAYVDNDPVVFTHASALLAKNESTTAVQADLRYPQEMIESEDLRRVINFDEPVGVLLVAVLHFVADEYDPAGVIRTLREAIPSGSYLALTHFTHDGPTADDLEQSLALMENVANLVPRSRQRIQGLFDGFELIPPGLVRPWEWRPDSPGLAGTPWLFAGVARKP